MLGVSISYADKGSLKKVKESIISKVRIREIVNKAKADGEIVTIPLNRIKEKTGRDEEK